jgi:heavy metal sensor kinase
VRWTIRRKLALWYAGLLLVVLVVLGVVLYQALARSLRTQVVVSVSERTEQILAAIGSTENGALDESDEGGSHFEVSDPDLITDYGSPGVFIEIQDAAGSILNQSPQLRGHSLAAGELESVLTDSNLGTIEIRELPQIGPVLIHTRQVTAAGLPTVTLRVGRSIQFIDEALAQLRFVLFVLTFAGTALAVAVGAVLAKKALAPIDHITQTARKIGVEDLHRRLHIEGPDDEVTRLAAAFDEMLDRVEAGFRRERQFSADVAHELRTPLTILKGTAEVALRPGGGGLPAFRDALESIGEETDRMIRIVEALLLLSRSESGQFSLTIGRVSLPDLCRDVAASFSSSARKRRVSLSTELVDSLVIEADAELIQQLLRNLMANALSYTPRGGRITLSLRREGSYAVVSVSDTGIGIPAEDLPHIFERFYRIDRSRSRRVDGVGLGLSIALAIAEAHKGRISVASQVNEGSTFSLWLPLSQSPIEAQSPRRMEEGRPRESRSSVGAGKEVPS